MMELLNRCAAIVGLDWADQKHDLCLKEKGSDSLEFSELKHCPKAIQLWAQSLQERFSGQPVAICLEQKKGPVIRKRSTNPIYHPNPEHPTLMPSSMIEGRPHDTLRETSPLAATDRTVATQRSEPASVVQAA